MNPKDDNQSKGTEHPWVKGKCPACRLSALFLGSGGHITCGNLACPNPDFMDALGECLNSGITTPAPTSENIKSEIEKEAGELLEGLYHHAHQYLLEHFKEFDFIWASPPCPSHSRLSTGLAGWGIHRYPDMSLYQEIIFLKHFFKGKWVVENVIPYYDVLIHPTMVLDRHYFWSNFYFEPLKHTRDYSGQISDATVDELKTGLGLDLPTGTKNARKLLRNAVDPRLGLHIFNQAHATQGVLL